MFDFIKYKLTLEGAPLHTIFSLLKARKVCLLNKHIKYYKYYHYQHYQHNYHTLNFGNSKLKQTIKPHSPLKQELSVGQQRSTILSA
jgi:hypothetical protein